MENLVNFEDFSKYFLKFQSYLTQLLIRLLLYIFLDEFSFFRISLDILNYKFYSSFQKSIHIN